MALDKDTIEGIVQTAVQEAVAFVESEISPGRIKAQRYFDGEVDIGEEEGRSKVVATKVRDTIRAIKPSLLRVFLSTDKPVEYVPRSQEQVEGAEQATKYIHYKFDELNGFRVLTDAFHDALLKKSGVVKVFWEDYTEGTTHSLSNLTEQEFSAVVNDDSVDVLQHTTEIGIEVDEFGSEIEAPIHSLKIRVNKERGKLCVEAVPPEEFFIDSNARSIDDYYVCGQKTEMRVGDLVAMGFAFEEVSKLSAISSDFADAEQYERNNYQQEEQDTEDLSMKLVQITEAYMQMDMDGSGIPQLYKFILGGNDYQLLDYEEWADAGFAVFEVDPEPHSAIGNSVADLILNDQDAATAMLRGVLDNVAMTNNPRLEVVEDATVMDDVLNNEIGGIIRSKMIGSVAPMTVPFIAGTTLPAIQYMDQVIEEKTGVTRASMGLDTNALQNSTATAAALTAQRGAGQIEVIARNLAEGGMSQLFKLMLKLVIENSDEEEMMRLNGSFVPMNPKSWDMGMDVRVNVGLGTGQDEQRQIALQQALQLQMQIWGGYGPNNGLVTMTGIRNTIADTLAVSGVRNADRYFEPMDPQTEQQIIQAKMQEAQAAGQASDPNMAFMQAEQMKAQAKMMTDQQKLQAQQQKDMLQAQMKAAETINKDDLERDRMAQQLEIERAKIAGQYGTAVDIATIRAEQEKQRTPSQ